MNTFDAIAQIRKQDMDRSDAMKFLVEHLGMNATYADEIAAVVFGGGFASSDTANLENSLARKTA